VSWVEGEKGKERKEKGKWRRKARKGEREGMGFAGPKSNGFLCASCGLYSRNFF